METLRFTRADFAPATAELTFKRILGSGAPPTERVGEEALSFLEAKMRELWAAQPELPLERFGRQIGDTYPEAMRVIMNASTLFGRQSVGYADPEADATLEAYELEGV